MAVPDLDPTQFTTFEITMPQDSENAVVLSGLASAYGHNLRERQTTASDLDRVEVPDRFVIQEPELCSISDDIFDMPDYGKTAQSILDAEKSRGSFWHRVETKQVPPTSRGRTWDTTEVHIIENSRWQSDEEPEVVYEGTRNLDYERRLLQEAIARTWGREQSPHAAPTPRPTSEEYKSRWGADWEAETVTVTRERLAHFLRDGELDKRFIAGALGKAVDVLKVSAGLAVPAEARQKWASVPKEPYIAWKDLDDAARPPRLTPHGRKQLLFNVRAYSLYVRNPNTSRNYMPDPTEITIEGNVISGKYRTSFDYLAVGSLEALFAKDNPENITPRFVKRYLKDLDDSQLHYF